MNAETSNNARRQVGILAVIGMAVRILSQSMMLGLVLLAGRFLTVELFGVFVLASILMNFAVMQMYSGVYHYVLKQPDFEEKKGTAFTLQAAFAVLFSVLILAAAGLVWISGFGDLLAQLIAATALMPVVAMIASWQEAVLLRKGDVKFYYGALFLSEFIGFVVGVVMLVMGVGVWALIANKYIASIIIAVALSFKSDRFPRPQLDRADARSILNFSLSLYGNSALAFFSAYGAAIVLGGFLSATAVGLYRMGARTATAAFDIFAQTFRVLVWQAVGRQAREEELTAELWTRLLGLDLCIMIFVLGSFGILAEDLTLLLLGEQWLGMVQVLQITCLIKVIASVDLVVSAQLAAAGDTKFLFRTRMIEGTIMLVILLVTVQFGLIAVTLGLVPPAIVYAVLVVQRMARLTGASARYIANAILPGIALALISLGAVYIVAHGLQAQSQLMTISVTAIVGTAAFLGLAFFVVRGWTMKTLHRVSVAILPAREATDGQVG